MNAIKFFLGVMAFFATLTFTAEEGSVLAHPPFASMYTCSEHWSGQFKHLGDVLGTDCMVTKLVAIEGRTWSRTFSGSGSRNSDWYSWQEAVLSPISGSVEKIQINSVTNEPGLMGSGPASSIHIVSDSGINFLVAHIMNPSVQEGDSVAAGQVLAVTGNNGYSRNPHIHLGAWHDEQPLQIRFDQTKMSGQ